MPAASVMVNPCETGSGASPAVSYRYTSLTHLGFKRSVASTPVEVRPTVDAIADFLRANGATLVSITEEKVSFSQSDGDASCEAWSNDIFKQELLSFDQNKLKNYKHINRNAVPVGCSSPKASWLQYGYTATLMSKEESGEGYKIMAVVDRSVGYSQASVRPIFSALLGGMSSTNLVSMVPVNVNRSVNLETVIVVFVWRKKDEPQTSVFSLATPRSDGIEASPNATIGYAYHRWADGRAEAAIAQNILSFVAQKALIQPSK